MEEKRIFAIGAAIAMGAAIGFACKSIIVGAVLSILLIGVPYFYFNWKKKQDEQGNA